MGYTHYWTFKDQNLDTEKFQGAIKDIQKMIPILDHLGVKLRDGFGEGSPITNDKEVHFNGDRSCGHRQRDIGLTWPALPATGIAVDGNGVSATETWCAGRVLDSRTCDGDCSYETFSIERDGSKANRFDCCKTAYRPYDLAVTVSLVIFQHWFQSDISVRSDGDIANWKDALDLCKHHLGYGQSFKFTERDEN
jgi:hypothetical protein